MAITWSAVAGANNQRVGIDVTMSPTTVGSGTASVTLTVLYYTHSQFAVSDNQTLTHTGHITGSRAFNMNVVGSNVLVDTRTLVVNTSHASSVTRTFTTQLSGHFGGATPSVTVSFTVPQRPFARPAAQTSVANGQNGTVHAVTWTINPTTSAPYASQRLQESINDGPYVDVATLSGTATSHTLAGRDPTAIYHYRLTATNSAGSSDWAYAPRTVRLPAPQTAAAHVRNSDTQNTVSWSLGIQTNAGYASQEVFRSVNGGAYAAILTTLSATATSYIDASCVADSTYRYRLRARNAAGLSGFSNETTLTRNTPAATGTPTAVKLSEASVRVDFTNVSNSADATEIWRSVDGAAATLLHTSVGRIATFTDTTAPAGSLRYQTRNRAGSLLSALSALSFAVTTASPPDAPTLLTTTPNVHDPSIPIRFAWAHNSTDGSEQRRYELELSVNAGAWVSQGIITSATQEVTLPAGTFPNGASVQWRVKTWGLHANPSPVSLVDSFTCHLPPAISITGPTQVSTRPFDVTWAFSGVGVQSEYSLTIRHDGAVVFSSSAASSVTTVSVDVALAHGETYDIALSARSSVSGLIGSAAAQFVASFAGPPPAVLTITPEPETGRNLVEVEVGVLTGNRLGPEASPLVFLEGSNLATGFTDASSFPVTFARTFAGEELTQVISGTSTTGSEGGLMLRGETVIPFDRTSPLTIRGRAASHSGSMLIGMWLFRANGTTITTEYRVVPVAPASLLSFETTWAAGTLHAEAVSCRLLIGATADAGVSGHMAVRDLELIAAGGVTATHMTLIRETDGEQVTLGEGTTNVSILDPIPAVNRPVSYTVGSHAATGAVTWVNVPNTLAVGRRYYLNFGDNFERVVCLWGNVGFSRSPRSQQSVFAFAGRKHPVMFTGDGRTETLSLTAEAFDSETVSALRALADDGRSAILRTPDGDVVPVRATVDIGRSGKPYHKVSVEMEVLDA